MLEKDGRYFFYQPACGLIASGDSVASAHQKFEEARRLFLENVQRAGLAISPAHDMKHALGFAGQRGVAAEIGLFAAKCGLVLVLLAGIGTVAVSAIESSLAGVTQGVSRVFASLGSVTLADVVAKSDDIVRDLNTLPESRKEDLRRNVGEISRQLTPIVDAWRNPPTSAGPR